MPDTHLDLLPNRLGIGIGDNNPPPDAEILRDRLAEQYAHLPRRRDELLAGLLDVPAVISDDDEAGKASDLIKMMTACRKVAEAGKDAEKAPIIESGNVIMGFFAKIRDPLEKALKDLDARMTKFGREKAERERRTREEEARAVEAEAKRLRDEAAFKASLLEEIAKIGANDIVDVALGAAVTAEELARQAGGDAVVAQRAATVKAAELSRTRGSYGSVSSLQTFWDFSDFNRETLDLAALRAHLPEEALRQALRSFIRAGGRTIAGATIFENTRSQTR